MTFFFTWLINISFLVSSSFLTGAGSYNQTETMVCHQLYVVVSLKRGRRVKIWVKKTATSTGNHGPMSDLRHILSRLSPFSFRWKSIHVSGFAIICPLLWLVAIHYHYVFCILFVAFPKSYGLLNAPAVFFLWCARHESFWGSMNSPFLHAKRG